MPPPAREGAAQRLALEGDVMRAMILHWTDAFDFTIERYGPRAKEMAFGVAAALWVVLIAVVVRGSTFH
jgi:hypothetical protein